MKPRNYIMANVAKQDPTRFHTRLVEDEHKKLQHNRARRKNRERQEICESRDSNWQGKSQQLHCGRRSMVDPKVVALVMSVRI